MPTYAIESPRFIKNRLEYQSAGMWTRGKLLLNGVAQKKQKGVYNISDDAGMSAIIILKKTITKLVDPAAPVVVIDDTPIVLAPKLRWYEYAWAIGPGLPLLAGGGALPWFFAWGAAYYNCHLFRTNYSPATKYILTALISAATWISLIAVIIVLHILFPNLFHQT